MRRGIIPVVPYQGFLKHDNGNEIKVSSNFNQFFEYYKGSKNPDMEPMVGSYKTPKKIEFRLFCISFLVHKM